MRFYELDGGKILVDGGRYHRSSSAETCAACSVWCCRYLALQCTIRDNIAYGREVCLWEAIVSAAKAAQAGSLHQKPCPMATTPFSIRRLLTSRRPEAVAHYRSRGAGRSAVLILDEATSSVDTEPRS